MGKSTIVYVIGLTLLVGIALTNIGQNSIKTVDAYMGYYSTTQVHNIAVSGANVGTNYLLNRGSAPPNFGVTFFGGTDSVSYTLNVPQPLWVTLRSVAVTNMSDQNGIRYRDTVEGVFKHVQFAKFSWFTESEINGYIDKNGNKGPYYGYADWKITGDSVWGPAHTNNHFNFDGTPYFHDKITGSLAAVLGPTANPVYNGGFQWGIQKKRPNTSALEARLTAAAGWYYDGNANGGKDVALTFINDNVRVQSPPGGGGMDTTMPITTLAPGGVMVVKNADLRIKGVYSGSLTVAAFSGTGAAVNKGNVWIDGSVTAKINPVNNPSSPDMLGIVAGRMAYITQDNTRNASSQLNIQAAVYCQNGELTAENFWNIPVSGSVNLFGGVTQISAGSLGVFNPGPPLQFLNGFSYRIHNDARFDSLQPPSYPYSDSYELVSWWED
jgi:hypothetical protein